MSVEVLKEQHTLKIIENAEIEDAETIFELLQKDPKLSLDLSECKHLHTSCLQVLMLMKPNIVAWPKDKGLYMWLSFLENGKKEE